MVSEGSKAPAIQEIVEVSYCQVQGEELPVDRAVLPIRRVKLATEKGERPSVPVDRLLQHTADRGVRGIHR